MQLTTPMEPARAVSTAINTLSSLLQSTFLDIYFLVFLVTHNKFFHLASRFLVSHEIHEIHEITHRKLACVGSAECTHPGGSTSEACALLCFSCILCELKKIRVRGIRVNQCSSVGD